MFDTSDYFSNKQNYHVNADLISANIFLYHVKTANYATLRVF